MNITSRANLSGVDRSVGKISAAGTVDKPTAEELARLVGERIAPPFVQAQELAAALEITPGMLSKFERGRRGAPAWLGAKAYLKTLEGLKRAKRQGAAA